MSTRRVGSGVIMLDPDRRVLRRFVVQAHSDATAVMCTVGPVIEDTLSFRLLKAMKVTRPAIWPTLAELNLYPGQDLLLSQLWRADGITQSALVDRIGVERPTITKALQRLERVGFLRREAGSGRSRTVHLTAAGWALREPVERAWHAADLLITAELSSAESVQLSELLARIGRAC